MQTHVTFSGKTIEYEPTPVVAAIIDRLETMLRDPRTTHDEMLVIVFSTKNPLMDAEMFPPYAMATARTLDDPAYSVMRDLLYRKEYERVTRPR